MQYRDRLRSKSVRLATATLGVTVVIGASLVPTVPSAAEPSIDDVTKRVDTLFHQAEQAQERYNDAKLELADIEADLKSLEADQARQSTRLEAVRERVQDSIVSQYMGQNLSAVGQVVVSDDPSAFLGELSTMSAYNDLTDAMYDEFATEAKELDIRQEATEKRAAEAAAVEAQLAAEKSDVDARLAKAKDLLADLKEQQREEVLSRGGSVRIAPTSVPASGRAAIAVRTALAQVGDAYVYGASGPGAFDCSGLTMFSWGAAGVGLPHSSGAQFGSGPRISASNLQPGDLVFYYSPISHVGMYIGNGLIVHAANPGTGVVVSGLYSMPFSGAVRPG